MDVGGRKEDVDSCQVEYTSMVVFKDFVSYKFVAALLDQKLHLL